MEKILVISLTIIYLVASIYFFKNKIRNNIFDFVGILLMSFCQSINHYSYNYLCAIIVGLDLTLLLVVTRKKGGQENEWNEYCEFRK